MKSSKSKITRAKAARILRYLRPYLLLEFAIALIMVLTVALGLIDPLVLKIVIDDVLVDRNTALLDILVAALIGLFLLRVVLNVLTNYLFQFVGQRILFDIRFQLFEHLEKLHLDFFHHTKTGEIMSRVNNDVEKLQGVVTSTFIAIITDFVTVVAVLAVIFYLDWKLTLLALTLFPFLFISQLHMGRKVKQKSRETREKSAEILSFFQETISGIKLVQSFVKEKFEARRLIRKSRELINLRIRLGVLGGLTASLAGFMAAMGPM
ncbi:MAG: ABC transporter ATP-binding protein, partial [Candidatus Zixiibacteriota bacterium]